VSRSFLVQNLVRNTNINLAGIGITLIGLQASGKGRKAALQHFPDTCLLLFVCPLSIAGSCLGSWRAGFLVACMYVNLL
jgi:hypothetical protein